MGKVLSFLYIYSEKHRSTPLSKSPPRIEGSFEVKFSENPSRGYGNFGPKKSRFEQKIKGPGPFITGVGGVTLIVTLFKSRRESK